MIQPPISDFSTRREIAKRRLKELADKAGIPSDGLYPSIRKAAGLLGINRDAVWQAYRELESDGFIVRTRNGRYRRSGNGSIGGPRSLELLAIAVGEGAIRFSGMQRFYDALVQKGSAFDFRMQLKCVMDSGDIQPEWAKNADCTLVCGAFRGSETLQSLREEAFTLAILNGHDWDPHVRIDSDDAQIGRSAAERLFAKGVRKPCLLAYDSKSRRHLLRKLGFQSYWLEQGGALEDIGELWIDPSCTYSRVTKLGNAMGDLVECHDGIYCLEKYCAVDAMNLLARLDVAVPSNIKVISTDGTYDSLRTSPTLTIVRQRFEGMAEIAVQTIRSRFAEASPSKSTEETRTVLLPGDLVERESA